MRSVRDEEWPLARQLRLDASQDPAAPVAFLDSYEAAVARPDAFWQDRTAAAAEEGGDVRQFVAESPEGEWVGTVTVLIERPEDDVRFGLPAEVNQGRLVGVFVRPEVRGAGVTDALFRVAVDWAWSLSAPRLERVHLYVHENNPRAAAFYRRFGFVPSGQRMLVPEPEPEPEPGSGTGERREWELEYVIERG